ncbi:hypothetical protein Cni_G19164 [Canna indica]|uniref:Uncharacterized protein n=1 Tax=Canna indica TaxID=4628 RepID=A0AAQ3QGP4_9LILI|nr:hypothetical protein Cni_G19164 [Canna indica]
MSRGHLRYVCHQETLIIILMEIKRHNELLSIAVVVLIFFFHGGPHRPEAEEHIVDLVNPGLPLSNHLDLLPPSPVGPADQLRSCYVEAWAISAGISNNVSLVDRRGRRVGALERIAHLPTAAMKDEEGARGRGGAGPGAEEQEGLIGAANAEAIEASQGGIGAEVGAALPDAVGVGGCSAGEERKERALEVEPELQVEVRYAAERSKERGEAAAELGPSGAAVVPEQHQREAAAAEAERLLERSPPGGVLQGRVGAGVGERSRGCGAVEADGEVERRVPSGHVAAVEHGSDLGGEALLAGGVSLGGHLGRVDEAGKRGDESTQRGRVAHRDGVMRRAVRVLVYSHSLFVHSPSSH